ncbi:LPS export ABC transporter permease LptF [Aliishimia ponticola]|uniref:LPS export ABC transporter permease LptF n=1 Tax=Aliishimia ponticola TaxID=2499833 RepID=A0A4S4NHU6_9RHOB|nr:LPS export ABC transporter permease LptF [Aliishimia ponticola]THH38445.1 LPS export ABC transporter permease LptF [Aliishimia ponticola]
MAKFDRYMLSQLLLYFGFFALVLVAVFWITRAVNLFDQLIADGQSVLIFLEFTALGLPGLVQMVVPLASFAAAVYVTNKMNSESELTVMLATGWSPWRLARPVAVFGVIVALMVSVLSHLLVPAALDLLTKRETEVSKDVTARLLTEGTFLHPIDGVTLYTREIGEDGVLKDVFLSDRRDPGERIIYTASTAYLVRQSEKTSLIMVDGLAQRLSTQDNRLSTATFRDFSYDITGLITQDSSSNQKVRAMLTHNLLGDWDGVSQRTGQPLGVIAEEVHSRFSKPLFAMITALTGFAVLMSGGFSRFGAWREIILAFGALLVLDSIRSALVDPVRDDAQLWPVVYLPPVLGAVLALVLIHQAAKPLRRRKESAA